MNKIKHITSLCMVGALGWSSIIGSATAAATTTLAQQRRTAQTTNRATSANQAALLVRRMELHTGAFRTSLDAALDTSRIDGTRREDNINELTRDFENAVDQLRGRFNRQQATAADVEIVLDRAALINSFVTRNRLALRVQQDWALVRTDLNQLARLYSVAGLQPRTNRATSSASLPTSPNTTTTNQTVFGVDPRLTGTYQLDTARSQNPTYVADRVSRGLPASQRQRVYDTVLQRVDPPEALAIERTNRQVTIASSRAPQVTFDADGRERAEQTVDGRTVRTNVILSGTNLVISSSGDPANDFSVTFTPLDAGNRLSVTRRVFIQGLTQPVVVESFYNRTSTVAQLDIYNRQQDDPNTIFTGGTQRTPETTMPGPTTGGTTTDSRTNGEFIVRDGTPLVVVLNDALSTQTSRDNDRFTMTVRDPSEFDGAVIEGYVGQISRSGRVSGRSGLSLNFERIRLRNGRSYKFAGFIDSVRAASGETVRVDNEGSVQDNNSQTRKTTERAAIGSAVGALIGAIAGGGKGAAIGAILGAGAGAGSVYAQGREELDLPSGTELTVRASAPRL